MLATLKLKKKKKTKKKEIKETDFVINGEHRIISVVL